jgi:hypothetical protein
MFGLLSMGIALAITVTYAAVFGLLSISAALAIATPVMLDLRPVRLIP